MVAARIFFSFFGGAHYNTILSLIGTLGLPPRRRRRSWLNSSWSRNHGTSETREKVWVSPISDA